MLLTRRKILESGRTLRSTLTKAILLQMRKMRPMRVVNCELHLALQPGSVWAKSRLKRTHSQTLPCCFPELFLHWGERERERGNEREVERENKWEGEREREGGVTPRFKDIGPLCWAGKVEFSKSVIWIVYSSSVTLRWYCIMPLVNVGTCIGFMICTAARVEPGLLLMMLF